METVLCQKGRKSHHNYKQTYFDKYGYLRFIFSKKLVSRFIIEKITGKKLDPDEVVHHINENKLDNSPKNLKRCKNRLEHNRIHGKNNSKQSVLF